MSYVNTGFRVGARGRAQAPWRKGGREKGGWRRMEGRERGREEGRHEKEEKGGRGERVGGSKGGSKGAKQASKQAREREGAYGPMATSLRVRA
eukprot:1483521-Rhodomonas_salina.1